MTKKYLVTGATGFLGSALVRRLVRDGHRVRAFDNNSRGRLSRLGDVAESVEWLEGDVRDSEAVAAACRGVECVCHLAFVNGTEHFYSKPELVLEVGVKGMVNVLDGCIKADVPELILTSSSEVYQSPPTVPTDETVPLMIPDPLNPRYSYAGGKIISELMAINYGRKHFERVAIVRPHNVYGPDMGWEHVVPQFVRRMRECWRQTTGTVRFPIQGTGQETRAFVFIDDFIAGMMCVVERAAHLGIYHVGTTEELTIEEVAREVGRFYGREVVVVPGAPAVGGTPRRCPDIAKLRALGYAPRVSFRQGLATTAQWYDATLATSEVPGRAA
jgi:nucleoside-diphosphate-sugar epimerase